LPERAATHKRNGAMPTETVEIIAHRGYSARAPENTLAALHAAVAGGADAVEFDLRVAACGTPVLFHDSMLSRTTDGVGPLRRRTLAQLKTLDAGAWFSHEFSGETIPSFAEALDCLSAHPGRVYAEVKDFREPEDLDRMVSVARDARMLHRVFFISLNWTVLERLRGRDPELFLGYVVAERQGTELAVWTVDDPSEASRLRELGVRRITTNEVERLVAWRASF
jgi:glycerophosphoryl diester phosphodiesterase